MSTQTVVLFFLSFFAIFATAAPHAPTTMSQCNTGDVQCCKTVGAANSLPTAAILGMLGIVLQDVSTVVGLGCTPISVLGVGEGANCAQQPVCCTNNKFSGLINIGCTPISL